MIAGKPSQFEIRLVCVIQDFLGGRVVATQHLLSIYISGMVLCNLPHLFHLVPASTTLTINITAKMEKNSGYP